MAFDLTEAFLTDTPVTVHQEMLAEAYQRSLRSPDPNTKVGAILARSDLTRRRTHELGSGHNCLPTGVKHTHERWHDRETKLRLVVHAEVAAVMDAAIGGRRTRDSIIYVSQTDPTGVFWGSPPCVRCAVHLIQAGVRAVITWPPREGVVSKWAADHEEARLLLQEAHVFLHVVPRP